MMTVSIPNEGGNAAVKDGTVGKMVGPTGSTTHRFVAGSASFIALSLAVGFAGCSSSSNNNTNPSDGGGDGPVHHEAGSSSGDDGGDGGATCPSNVTFTPAPYAPVTAHQGLCKAADIAAFVAACTTNNQTACDAWKTTNAYPDGGTACGLCIVSPTNAGGVWQSEAPLITPNYGGCVQLTDPTTHGSACAAAIDSANDCDFVQCYQCNTSIEACYTTVESGICKPYQDALTAACGADLADGGVVSSTCGLAGGGAEIYTNIIQLICGSADGG
jgi:hypothetical protein